MNKKLKQEELVDKIIKEVKKEERKPDDVSDQCKEIKEKWQHYATVGDLLEFIYKNNISRDAKILLQRVEDVYFNEHHWTTINKEGENYHYAKNFNDELLEGKYENKDEYPEFDINKIKPLEGEKLNKFLEDSKDKYYACWSPVKYSNDDNLYLDAHY
jgi:hypothetical protein